MTERTREALFSSLGVLDGARVLDLFAGSGSLGLEALSRGATDAIFVESGRSALSALRANVTAVGLGGTIVSRDVGQHLAQGGEHAYDLVFVDPPFAMDRAIVKEVVVAAGRLLDRNGVLVLHRRHGEEPLVIPGLELEFRRRYGDSEVFRYREAIGDDSALSREL